MNSVRLQHIKSICRKSVALLFTNNEAAERETDKTIPLIILQERGKYLGINLTKEVKDLYYENYDELMKETEDDTKKWKDISCSYGKNKYCLMSYYPKQSTDLMESLSK